MKKSELFVLIGNTMRRAGIHEDLVRGLGLERRLTIADDMYADVKLDDEDMLQLINGLSDANIDRVMFWIGAAIRDLSKS